MSFAVDLGIADSRCLLIVCSSTGTRNRPLERVGGGAEDEEAWQFPLERGGGVGAGRGGVEAEEARSSADICS